MIGDVELVLELCFGDERGKATPLRVWEPREIWIWILGKELLGDRRFDSRELRGHPGLTSFSHSETLSQNILLLMDHGAIEVLFV